MANKKTPDHKALYVTLAFIISLILAFIAGWRFIGTSNDETLVRDTISGAGVLAPVVYITLQVLQVIIAPIPGSVISLAGGYIFGAFWGTIFNIIGSFIGFFTVFVIAKKFGRPFIAHFISLNTLNKYDAFAKKRGIILLVIAFLVPVVPDAPVGYAAGLTNIKLSTLMFLSMTARLPGIIILNIIGSQTAKANYDIVLYLIIALVLVLATAYYFKDFIAKKLRINQ